MGKMLLSWAAAIAIAAPATAGTPEEPFVGFPEAKANLGTFTGVANVNVGGGGFHGGFGHHPGFGDHRFKRFGRGGGGSHGVWINGGQWAQYNNEAFKSDGYNDWWHDRPDRAYPAWVRNNQNCARQWYAGNTLRC